MQKHLVRWPLTTRICALTLLLGAIYAWLTYYVACQGSMRALTSLEMAVQLSIVLPVIAIWTIAGYGAARLKQYGLTLKNTKDGDSLNDIATALLILVPYIILLSVATPVEALFRHSRHLPLVVALGNYLPILVSLVSVFYLLRGSNKLIAMLRNKKRNQLRFISLGLACLFLFGAFAWGFYRAVPLLEPVNGIPRFAASINTLLVTYVLPQVILWGLGIWACLNIAHYAQRTEGKIYRQLFQDLYWGILLVYICLFIAQMLVITSFSYARFNLSLGLIYGAMALAVVGFVYIVRGAKKLTTVEN